MSLRMFKLLNLLILSFVASCGGHRPFTLASQDRDRVIASVVAEQLMVEEAKTFAIEIDERLLSLHSYYVIAQKHLYRFDESIQDKELEKLYQSRSYLSLITIRSQVEEIEKELISIHEASTKDKEKQKILIERIKEFSEKSVLSRLSMENLNDRLGKMEPTHIDVSLNVIEAEYKKLEATKEFQIYEKNIEHLSHLLEMSIRSDSESFGPSVNKNGNITGEEFPSKVWSLTFNNGPDSYTTEKIMDHLLAKNIKATFFQLNSKLKKNQATSLKLRDAGMELASNSHSLQDLTKVGSLTLEKEITVATKEMESNLKIDVKFFRLPYGSGATVPNIRQKISQNDLIHVFWNVDTLDWMAQTPDRIIKRTKSLMKKTSNDSGIILFHDIHHRSIKASVGIMDHLNSDARRSCTLGQIVKDMNEGAQTVCSKN